MTCGFCCYELMNCWNSISIPLKGGILILLITSILSFISYCVFDPRNKFTKINSLVSIAQLENYFLKNAVYLNKAPTKLFPRFIDFMIGNWNVFANVNHLNTKIFIKTVLLVSHFAVIFWIVSSMIYDGNYSKISNEAIVALIASFPVIFWHHHGVFYKKWKHCSDFLHSYLHTGLKKPELNFNLDVCSRHRDHEIRVEDFNQSLKEMEHTVLIDLIHLDLWAHKSFYRSFNHILINRVKDECQDEGKAFAILKDIADGKWSVSDVEDLLRRNWYLNERL